MKTTVYVSESKRISVAPTHEAVLMQLDTRDPLTSEWHMGAVFVMTMDQVGALLFGLEQAAEVVEVRKAHAQYTQGVDRERQVMEPMADRYGYAGKCERTMKDGKPCGLNAPCPDCGPSLIG